MSHLEAKLNRILFQLNFPLDIFASHWQLEVRLVTCLRTGLCSILELILLLCLLFDSLSWLSRKSVGMEKTPTQPGDRGRERQVAGSGETHRKPRGGQHGAGPSAWAEGPRDPRLRPAATPGSAAGARNRQTDVQRPRATLGKPAVPFLLGQVSAERRAPLAMERGAQSAFRSEGLPPS